MGYIIKINSESKQALAFLEFAKSLDFVKVTKEKTALVSPTLNPQQEKFKKKFVKALQEVKDIRAGKKKARNLDEVLNEL
ncbi:hypothetical protein [Capnocytophaga canimorsus]|uniref:Uncharacterized protein n=2 Tax=Capnocytophaga canimorsus TaxID=28188 RepID=F9YPR1_CAPCC|nr:hypothetical protein [Capnocytophaga canimorsus]AEK23407.1 Conserved hypothetical protein [Capnocytophaga canimorsus Cc5]ATA91065.1 hypothetical protein CGC56_02105 [Capnocytophaga canimorsus]WGU67974.1 hypothetical protein QIU19_11310 [Capnocytophaga canimorsus]WGU70927.1 hypothetical protein QIU18_02525 [Capnocytophaga canimorsus]CEN45909.1 conserved hypothetical protein [Capnocytophaga canimorsus]